MGRTKSDKTRLSERQLKAIPFLVSAASDGEGCRQAKIGRQTYYEWIKEPAFKAELSRLRNIVVEDAIQLLKAHTAKAVNTLVKLLDVDNPTIQRGAANDILQHVTKFKEIQEIEERLETLERRNP
jgi:hypothetical protein